MRERSGRVAALMVGSAIALAFAATPLAVDWTSLTIQQKQAEAKGDGGKGGGEGKGGDKGDKGGKGDKDKGDHAKGDKGDKGGSTAGGPSSADNGNGNSSDSTGEGQASSAPGSGTEPAETQTATASAAPDQVPARSALPIRTGNRSPLAVRRSVTVSVKTIWGRPPRGRTGTEAAEGQIRLAPVISLEVAALAAMPCTVEVAEPICPPAAAPPATAPAADIVPPAIYPAAGPTSDLPRDSGDDPARTQLTYAVPEIVVEPELRPNIDENIYGLMQVEAIRYIDTTIPILVVQGLVFNMSRTKRPVPPLVAIISDATGQELARWKFSAEAPILEPGASTGFRSETVDPAPNSTNVTVLFSLPDEPQIARGEADEPQIARGEASILAR